MVSHSHVMNSKLPTTVLLEVRKCSSPSHHEAPHLKLCIKMEELMDFSLRFSDDVKESTIDLVLGVSDRLSSFLRHSGSRKR